MQLRTYVTLMLLLLASSCKKDEQSTQPVVPTTPQVRIVSPLTNSSIGAGLVPVLVEATDDKGVSKVEVYVDSQLDTALSVPPYGYLWDTGSYPDSSRHAIFAKAYDTDNNVTGSAVVMITVFTLRPSDLQVTTAPDTLVTLQWRDNSRIETGYEIEQSENSGPYSIVKQVPANTTTTSIADTFHVATTYRFRVRAIQDSTVSAYSNVVSVSLQFLAPSNLTVTPLRSDEVRLSWVDNSTFEMRFLVERAANGGQSLTIATLLANAVAYSDTSLDTSNAYSYRVKAESRHNSSSYSNTISMRYFHPYENFRTTGHTNLVYSVAFSPNANTIASASCDNTVKLWRLIDGTLLRTLTGHTSCVFSIAYSPDGNTIVSGSDDHSIKLWRASDGALLRTLTGHTGQVLSVVFSPDGNTVASASTDRTIKLWRASDGFLLSTLTGHTNSVWSVAFSPNGNAVASGSLDNSIKLWRSNDGTLLRTLTGHTGAVMSVTFSPNGDIVASGSGDHNIKLWQVSDGVLLRTLTGHTGNVNSVAFNPDGSTIVSGSSDNTVGLFRVSDGTLLRTLTGHTGTVMSVTFSPGGQTIASGGYDNTVKLWQSTGSAWQIVP